jgi:N-acyl-D-amino-acid deacylase
MMFDILIQGGRIYDGTGNPWYYADVGIVGDRVTAIGRLASAEARHRIDATDKVVAPGFVDAHVHGDLVLLADPFHEPAVRQGVTCYVLGQDGVAMAPSSASAREYMCRYTAGFSGGALWADRLPSTSYLSLADYLSLFDRKCALNVCCLVPNGNARFDVVGLDPRPASAEELGQMGQIIRDAMEEGAVGLSSGLDYIPSLYANVHELTALCRELVPFNGIYVSHIRGYAPHLVLNALAEIEQIGEDAGVAIHISHLNCLADQVLPVIDRMRSQGIDVTYDMYCYLAGSTILAMVTLPGWVQEGGIQDTLTRLRDPQVRRRLAEWFAKPPLAFENIRLSYIAAERLRHLEGQTLAQAAAALQSSVGDLICDLLLESEMVVGCVVPHHPKRTDADIRALMRHPAMMGGSDGIYTGSRPHPRGFGCYARYIGHYVRTGGWTLEEAVQRLAAHPARRFGLKDRGILRERAFADVIVFDPRNIEDRATSDNSRQLAMGMEHVLVNGELVLHAGQRTQALPGRALRMHH